MSHFDLRKQSYYVRDLLNRCVESLPHLPPELKVEMEKNITAFENCAVPVCWTVDDIEDEFDLSLDDRKKILDQFVNNYEVSDIEHFTLRSETDTYLENLPNKN